MLPPFVNKDGQRSKSKAAEAKAGQGPISMLLSSKSSFPCNNCFSEITQDLITQSIKLESRKKKKAFHKPQISSPTNIPTHILHIGVRCKKSSIYNP